MDSHVGDDFPDDDVPDDFPEADVPDDAALPGVGDAPWEHDTVDLDDSDSPEDVAWQPETSETLDLAEDDFVDEPDVPADEPDEPDVPVVGDDSPVSLGADPDTAVADSGDGDWLDLPDLTNVEVPEPAGGPPWVDTGLLGDSDVPGDAVPATPDGGADDLRTSLGEPRSVGDPTGDAYQELVGSDDPAVRNLARLWGPPA
ncbi:hypothetical protein [Cryptosporangium sp. NPDC048952]|uniref:hypothetical protein n=1 Tax=Cryptosporangium sp. NPDC048952 TaxID=3363961 RepID=UPI00371B6EBE